MEQIKLQAPLLLMANETLFKITEDIDNPNALAQTNKMFRQTLHCKVMADFFLKKVCNMLGGNSENFYRMDVPSDLLPEKQSADKGLLALQKIVIQKSRVFHVKNPDSFNIFILPAAIDSFIQDRTKNTYNLCFDLFFKNHFVCMKKIIESSRISELTPPQLGVLFYKSAQNGYKEIVKDILVCSRASELSATDLGRALRYAAEGRPLENAPEYGHADIVKNILVYLNASKIKISVDDLCQAPILAAKNGCREVLKDLLVNPVILGIPAEKLGGALSESLKNATEKGHQKIEQDLRDFIKDRT